MSAQIFPPLALEVMQGAMHQHDTTRFDGCAWIAERTSHRLLRMPLPDRLALARALVPEYAVVPREATEAMIVAGEQEPLMSDAYRAMLAAVEATP